jgi:hypothetical protein
MVYPEAGILDEFPRFIAKLRDNVIANEGGTVII